MVHCNENKVKKLDGGVWEGKGGAERIYHDRPGYMAKRQKEMRKAEAHTLSWKLWLQVFIFLNCNHFVA